MGGRTRAASELLGAGDDVLRAVAGQAPAPTSLDDLIARLGEVTPVVPAPNRWWINPEQNAGPQPLLERALAVSGKDRHDMVSGAFLDPRSGEILDGRAYGGGVVKIDPRTGRPSMVVGPPLPPSAWESLAKADGPFANTNLVRRSVGWEPVAGDVDLPFLATAESGAKHFYGTGIAFDSPVLLRNTGGVSNPTLRPRARGSVYGNSQIGEMILKGNSHPVYDFLRIVPRGAEVPGTLLRYSLLAPLAAGASDERR